MNKAKKNILLFFLLSGILILLIPIFNYTIDRYRIFAAINGNVKEFYVRKDKKEEYIRNDRVTPVGYLVNHDHKFDSFIFGSSRVHNFDIERLGSNWYKLNYNSGIIYEHYHNIKVLLENKVKIKNIILTIDLFTLNLTKSNSSDGDKKYLYPISLKEWTSFIYKYLFKKIDYKDVTMYKKSDYVLENIEKFYIRNYPIYNLHVYNKPNNYIKKQKVDKKLSKIGMDFNLNIIKKIKKIAAENNITLKIIIMPSHYKNLYSYDLNNLLYFKKNLLDIVHNYYDFSLPHNYLIDNHFWHETVHYSSIVNTDIINLIMSTNQLCENFGEMITKKNFSMLKSKYLLGSEDIKKIKTYDNNLKIDKSFYTIEKINLKNKNFSNSCMDIIAKIAKIAKMNKITINDLEAIKKALNKFYTENGFYPISKGFDGVYSKFGYSGKDWIKGLSPTYIKELPIDPRLHKNNSQQYFYKSNGKDYKLIAHEPVNCHPVKTSNPELIDIKRDCWAYGFWTEKAKNW